MPLVAASNVRYSIGDRVILENVTLSVEPGERVGIVGRNGGGKTTLFRIIAGEIHQDSGEVIIARGARVGYLTQDVKLTPGRTVMQEAESGFAELTRLHGELDGVYHRMEEATRAGDNPLLERLMKRQAELDRQMEAAGGYAVDHKVEEILHGLGFETSQFSQLVDGLSGGQKGRLALAKLLLEEPDLLLLDEPTNHLDIAGREWLESFLVNDFKGAVIMVSHDRYMLDNVVHAIEEVERGRLVNYPGNYADYAEIRAQRRLSQMRAFENQQTKFRQQEAYIRRYKAGQRARQAKGRETRLEREKEQSTLERPPEMNVMALELPEPPRSGDLVAVVREAAKRYDTRELFRGLTVTISRGDRWGIIGPNGAGKTTLVNAMLGKLDLSDGTTKLGANVIVGYFSQMADQVDPSMVVWEYLQRAIRRENPGSTMSEQQARDLAGAFLFSGEDQDKPIGGLSGGERGRARLAALLASAKNLLILDEPTNHLDIPSAERLEDALAAPEKGEDGKPLSEPLFPGTVILISHDRALIDAVCEHLIILDGLGGVKIFHGNYSQWHEAELAAKAAAKQKPAGSGSGKGGSKPTGGGKPAAKAPEKKAGGPAPAAAPAPSIRATPGGPPAPAKPAATKGKKSQYSWMSMEKLEVEVAAAGAMLAKLDALLSDGDVYRDRVKFNRTLAERAAAERKKIELEEEWLKRAE
jgi:ATP-binding cassette subfamily F protein 3